jgi:hypothetical protein
VSDAESLFLLAVEASLLPPAPAPVTHAAVKRSSGFLGVQSSWCAVAGVAPSTSEEAAAGSTVVGWPEAGESAAISAAGDCVRLCSSAVTGVALCRLHGGQSEFALSTIREFVLASPSITACPAAVSTAMTLTDLCRGPQASVRDKEALKLAASAFGARHAVSTV